MIKLENISVSAFYCYLENNLLPDDNFEEYLDALRAMKFYSINNYQQLKDLIDKGVKEFNTDLFRKELKDVEVRIARANAFGFVPELYFTSGYDYHTMEKKELELTDERTRGDVLITKSLFTRQNKMYRIVSQYTIGDLKFMISHLRKNLKNVFRPDSYFFKPEDIERLVGAINFYEQQVIRQYEDVRDNYGFVVPYNFFDFNREQKREIVEFELKEIVEYLLDNGSSYVWGNFDDKDKLKLLNAAIKNNKNSIIRKNIIDVISDYTTYTELEDGIVKKKTLNRFIVK